MEVRPVDLTVSVGEDRARRDTGRGLHRFYREYRREHDHLLQAAPSVVDNVIALYHAKLPIYPSDEFQY